MQQQQAEAEAKKCAKKVKKRWECTVVFNKKANIFLILNI